MSEPETHPRRLSTETHVGEGVKQAPVPPHQTTGRPPESNHDLRDPGLHDLCRPENLHHRAHENPRLGPLYLRILYPAPQDRSAGAVWAPQAASMPVQSLLP